MRTPDTIGLQPMELQFQPKHQVRIPDTIGLQPMELQF
jgi:hypothetical protein